MASRTERHGLRREAGRLLGGRVRACGHKPVSELIQLRYHPDCGAHYAGLETCGSVWACPVCAAKIAEGRRAEVAELMRRHLDAGGGAYMAAFTIPHHVFQRAGELREAVTGNWRKLTSGAPWQRLRARYGLVGIVRALEVTHGTNGWHPHLHCLFLTEKPLNPWDANKFGQAMFLRWRDKIRRAGFGECTATIWRFEEVARPEDATNYVAKWGADSEIAKANAKHARAGGRSPWQLLADSIRGNRQAGRLFRAYAEAFKGARHLTWSRGLRERYGLRGEAADAELAAQLPEPAELVGALRSKDWGRVCRLGLTAQLLNVVEMGGWDAVIDWMRGYGFFEQTPRDGPPGGSASPAPGHAAFGQAGGGRSCRAGDAGAFRYDPYAA